MLPVQGPPGSGKTYTGARMILDLLAGGKRVGVTANSHKVISNLLAAVCDAADSPTGENRRTGGESGGRPARQPPVDVRGIQKANDGDGCPDERIVQAVSQRRDGRCARRGRGQPRRGHRVAVGARGDGRRGGPCSSLTNVE